MLLGIVVCGVCCANRIRCIDQNGPHSGPYLLRLGAFLHAFALLRELSGGADHRPDDLSEEWTAYLDRHAEVKNGLLNVVAECLNKVIIEPELEAIDAGAQDTWWQQRWSYMEQ
jgi:hypothetical protein